uniref:Uncharacterized protein n=1 Tax=Arundo donax TaxID=35708 RepID=A0A0A9EIS1_ARUDO
MASPSVVFLFSVPLEPPCSIDNFY